MVGSERQRTAAAALAVAVVVSLAAPAADAGLLGSQRVGTSAATFLKIGVGARAAGMGQAMVAVSGDPIAMFQNPAGLADLTNGAVVVERISWLTDLDVTAAGIAGPTLFGGSSALSVLALNVELEETTELEPAGTGRSFSHRDLAVGLSFARHLTDRFSFGVTGRLIYEALGTEIGGPSATTWIMDLGTTFQTGFRDVVLAVAIQNFGPDLTPGGGFVDSRPGQGVAVEYSGFAPPTTFRLGSTYGVWSGELTGRPAALRATGEFVRPADNDETMRAGAELELAGGMLMLRGGYDGASDALPWSGGAGVVLSGERFSTAIDYAFSQSEFFDRVDRLSLKIGF